jgi:hypothetical protein
MEAAKPREDNLKSVKELLEERSGVDNSAVFEQLRAIQDKLWAKITDRFELTMDESTRGLQPYHSLDGSAQGMLPAFTGPEVEWAVCSWVGNPKLSFCNLHITIWMKPHTYLPHLAFACGTFPVFFFLLDYIPRVEPTLHPDYLKKYMEPANARFLALQNDKRIMPFISQSAFVRAAVSATGYNFIAQPETEGTVELFDEVSTEMFDRWLGWSKQDDPVPMEKQAEIEARDLAIRRNTAELDPANVVVEKIYGKELTDKLVRGLWGGDRIS